MGDRQRWGATTRQLIIQAADDCMFSRARQAKLRSLYGGAHWKSFGTGATCFQLPGAMSTYGPLQIS